MRKMNKKLLVVALSGGMLLQLGTCLEGALIAFGTGLATAISTQFIPLNTIIVGDQTQAQ